MPSSSSVSPPAGGSRGGAAEEGGGGGRLEEVDVAATTAAMGLSWALEGAAGTRSERRSERARIRQEGPALCFPAGQMFEVWKQSHLLA